MYNVPNTGDDTNLTLYVAMLIIALVIMIGIAIHGFISRKGKVIDDSGEKNFNYIVGSEDNKTIITWQNDGDETEKKGVTLSKDDSNDEGEDKEDK